MKKILGEEFAFGFLDGLHRVTSLLNFASGDPSNLKKLVASDKMVSLNIVRPKQHHLMNYTCGTYNSFINLLETQSLNLTRYKQKTVGHTIIDVFVAIKQPEKFLFEHVHEISVHNPQKVKLREDEKNNNNASTYKRTILYLTTKARETIIKKSFGPSLFEMHKEFLKNETYFRFVKKSSGLKQDLLPFAREIYEGIHDKKQDKWSLQDFKDTCENLLYKNTYSYTLKQFFSFSTNQHINLTSATKQTRTKFSFEIGSILRILENVVLYKKAHQNIIEMTKVLDRYSLLSFERLIFYQVLCDDAATELIRCNLADVTVTEENDKTFYKFNEKKLFSKKIAKKIVSSVLFQQVSQGLRTFQKFQDKKSSLLNYADFGRLFEINLDDFQKSFYCLHRRHLAAELSDGDKIPTSIQMQEIFRDINAEHFKKGQIPLEVFFDAHICKYVEYLMDLLMVKKVWKRIFPIFELCEAQKNVNMMKPTDLNLDLETELFVNKTVDMEDVNDFEQFFGIQAELLDLPAFQKMEDDVQKELMLKGNGMTEIPRSFDCCLDMILHREYLQTYKQIQEREEDDFWWDFYDMVPFIKKISLPCSERIKWKRHIYLAKNNINSDDEDDSEDDDTDDNTMNNTTSQTEGESIGLEVGQQKDRSIDLCIKLFQKSSKEKKKELFRCATTELLKSFNAPVNNENVSSPKIPAPLDVKELDLLNRILDRSTPNISTMLMLPPLQPQGITTRSSTATKRKSTHQTGAVQKK